MSGRTGSQPVIRIEGGQRPERFALRPLVSSVSKKKERFESLDLARGLAILGMFLSHTVKGLMNYDGMPQWGLVPMHLMTKFASSLFIIIFGISLALFFIPLVDSLRWPARRNRLLYRALEIMFWYKILTLVQMFQTYPREMVVDTLFFRSFPDFVEVLGFYGFCLLWIPWFLPVWAKMHWIVKVGCVAGMAFAGQWLNLHFDFRGYSSIKTILVENSGDFTYGQFQRGSLVLFGLLLGDIFRSRGSSSSGRILVGGLSLFLALACAAYFLFISQANQANYLMAIAKNFGKHPPTPIFMAFSMGAALGILALCFFGGRFLSTLLRPATIIGQNSLFAFCFHIFFIFIVYRYIFNLRGRVSYPEALWLTALLTFVVVVICYLRGLRRAEK